MADREWILLNPGPANTTPTVRAALVMPDLCHREPEYFDMMRRCRAEATRLAGCGTDWTTVLFTGSGTAAVEATICSAVPADRALLVVDNGVYGDRMLKIARAHGIPAHAVRSDIFTPARPDEVEAALAAHPDVSHVALVHHETTTGLLNPVAEIARVAQRRGRRLIVDAMSSLFGESLDVCQEPLDFVAASANKCLQGVPGVSFVLARRAALEALRGRAPRSVYLDLHSHFATQEQDNTPFTPAVQVLHAMEQALAELAQEGLSRRVEILVAPEGRSNILTTFRLPSGVAYDALHDALKRRGYIIYAGQGDLRTYAFRVANMGTLTPRDMTGVVRAFAAAFAELGVPARAV
jgi:2-aminoethylphosphonate-pyruvate transaminase